jgi:hypothetical protein
MSSWVCWVARNGGRYKEFNLARYGDSGAYQAMLIWKLQPQPRFISFYKTVLLLIAQKRIISVIRKLT